MSYRDQSSAGYFYYDWQRNQKPFETLTSENATTGECDLTDRNPAQLSCSSVEGNFLPTLGTSPVLGRNFLPEEDSPNGPNVALISYGLWFTHYNLDRRSIALVEVLPPRTVLIELKALTAGCCPITYTGNLARNGEVIQGTRGGGAMRSNWTRVRGNSCVG